MGGEWMRDKVADASAQTLLILTILLTAKGFGQAPVTGESPAPPAPEAQQPATQQPPAAQSPNGQEPAEEQSSSRRKKPHDYKNWNYNVGLGANVDSGTTKTFVRGGGYDGTVGVARNLSKYLGLRGDFIFADLPLRQSSLSLAQAGSGTSYLFAFTVAPIINIPVTKVWGGYLLFGPGFYHRSGTLNSNRAFPGSSSTRFSEGGVPV